MKFMLRHSDKMVGVFGLAGILFLAGALGFVGVNKRWFQSGLEYRSIFVTAEGLSPGLDLKLQGFAIGRVKSVALGDDNQVEVVFNIFHDYANHIVPGSVIELAVQPLGFGSSLVLYPGINGGDPMPEGSFIPSSDLPLGRELLAQGKVVRPKRRDDVTTILEAVPPLVGQVETVINTLDRLLTRLDQRLNGDLGQPGTGLLETVDGTLHGVDTTMLEFGNLAAQLDSTVAKMEPMFESLAILARELENPEGLLPTLIGDEGSAAQFFQDDAALYQHLSDTLQQLQELMTFMNQSTPEISILLEETTAALKESEKVMQGLKNNPLLRGGIPPETESSSPFDGYREGEQ
jgi:phospholipid/cholesterol/gamma-HCH transport system substrate-binding protein